MPILKDKPFDPNEGEGALFQTPLRQGSAGQAGKKKQEQTASAKDEISPKGGNKTDSEKATAATTSITAAELKCEIDKAEGKEPSSKDCKTDPTSQKLRGTSNPTSQKLRGTSTPIPTKDTPKDKPQATPIPSK